LNTGVITGTRPIRYFLFPSEVRNVELSMKCKSPFNVIPFWAQVLTGDPQTEIDCVNGVVRKWTPPSLWRVGGDL